MGITVNATEAARLLGVSERTVRAWLTAGKIRGASSGPRHTPGKGPASWVIDTDALARLEGVTLDNDALRQLEAERAGVSAAILARLEALEAELATLREHSPWLFSRVARSEAHQTALDSLDVSEAIRQPVRRPRPFYVAPASRDGLWLPSANKRGEWIEAHGGPGAAWVRSWPEAKTWRTPEEAIATVRQQKNEKKWHNWTPRECADPACECHELLTSGAAVAVGIIEVSEDEV